MRSSGPSSAVLLALAFAAACGDVEPMLANDAAPDSSGYVAPDAAHQDAIAPLTWVDFAVSGCETVEEPVPACHGVVPFTLRFTALAPADVDAYLWSFGDGTDGDTQPSTSHTYLVPGSYTIELTAGGPGGTAQVSRPLFVQAAAAAIGAPCVADEGCDVGLACICPAGDCTDPLAPRGFCSRTCGEGNGCDHGTVCADLAAAGTVEPDGWRRPLCLRSCVADPECGALSCRELPSEADGGWLRGCFSRDLLADEGASCLGADAEPDDALCASGTCRHLGARGLCSAACDADAPCPSYAVCAEFSGAGGARCLASCDLRPCDLDPWLACEAPDPAGDLGFTLDPTSLPSAAGYCAPRRCSDDGACGLDGVCHDPGNAGFCGAEPS